MSSRLYFRAVVAAGVSLLSASASAQEDAAKTCGQAYEGAQEARKQAQLMTARDRLLVCSQDQCPKFIRKDCSGWLEEVRRSIPSFVIVAKDADGKDVMDFEAKLDGEPLEGSLSLAVEVDPGTHQLELTRAGSDPVHEELVLREGEHRRMVEVIFRAAEAAPAPRVATTEEPDGATGHASVVPYVLGGVGVLGLAGFAYFGLSGKGQRSDLESSCKPNCTQDQIDEVDQKFLFADVSLGIGVISLGVAAYLFLSDSSGSPGRGDSAARRSPVSLVATPGGAFAGYRGHF